MAISQTTDRQTQRERQAIPLRDGAAAVTVSERGPLPHILLVIDQFSKTLGGGERILLKLAALLPDYGYRVSILTFMVDPDSPALNDAPCPIYVLPMARTCGFASLRGAWTLRRFIRRQRIGVVQTFFESSDIWAGLFTKLLTSARLIWSRRDMGILRSRKHAIAYRWMAPLPDAVFAVSEQVRRHAIEVDGIDPARVLTIYNGLTLADWNARPVAKGIVRASIVCTAGNIRRVKGHDTFIKAAALISPKFPDAVFRIAGAVLEQEYFDELQTLVKELGLAEKFEFSGGIRQLSPYLGEASIFVLPSRSEGFSNAIVEAMAASLPVIATTVGGNAEAVEDGVTGVLIPPEDVEALSAAMESLMSDPSKAERMGLAGREVVARDFTTEVMMERTTEAYRRLLDSH